MWFQVALCMMAVGAYAHPHATSHQSRTDRIDGYHIQHDNHDVRRGMAMGYGQHGHDDHHNHRPSYEFSYSVHDPHTGDQKSAHEIREGDNVKGAYALVEPDGNVRSVHYTADHKNGFQAVVHHKTVHRHDMPHHDHGRRRGHHEQNNHYDSHHDLFGHH